MTTKPVNAGAVPDAVRIILVFHVPLMLLIVQHQVRRTESTPFHYHYSYRDPIIPAFTQKRNDYYRNPLR